MTAVRPRLLHRASPVLFSEFVAQCTVAIDPSGDWEPETVCPEIVLPPAVARAVSKRRREFVAGRYCAREAMRTLGVDDPGASVRIGRDREPVWPPGVVGSITHTDGIASVAVAPASRALGLGLDIERWMDRAVAAEVRDSIVTDAEIEALASGSGYSLEEVLTVAYSAKETLFKCLFSAVGHYFDFKDATIERIDTASTSFTARLVVPLAATLPAGTRLHGRWTRDDDYVSTGMLRLRDEDAR